MRILCIADEENRGLWDHFDKGKLKDIDLILSAGDLHSDYLQFLVTMGNGHLFFMCTEIMTRLREKTALRL